MKINYELAKKVSFELAEIIDKRADEDGGDPVSVLYGFLMALKVYLQSAPQPWPMSYAAVHAATSFCLDDLDNTDSSDGLTILSGNGKIH